MRCFTQGKFQAPAVDPSLATAPVEALLADRSGRIWIGTAHGLFANLNGTVRAYSTRDGLPANGIGALYEDRKGDIWAGTDGGIARISGGKVERFPTNDFFSNNLILSMLEDREGSMWFGSETAGLSILRDQKFTTYTNKDGLGDDLVHCVYQDRRGILGLALTLA